MFEKRKLASAITLALALPTTMSVEVVQAAASFATGNVETTDVSIDANYCASIAPGTAAGQGVINTGATHITYATELFGSGSVTLPDDSTTGKWPAVIYTTDGDISKSFNMTFSLSNGASFADTVLCGDDKALDGSGTNTGDISTTADSGETVTYKIQINTCTGIGGDTVFNHGSKLVLAYKLTNTQALAVADEDIEMMADLRTITVPPTPVNPALTTTVAKSATAISAKITPQATGTVKISVGSESKEFVGTAESYQNSTTAEIGLLEVKQVASYKRADGINDFAIGSGKVELDGTTLVIESGQFDASKASPGKVFLANTGDDAIIAEAETVDDDGTATFELDSDEVASIISVTGGGNDVGIRFQVDGKTPINSVENPPPATFTLSYDDATIAGLEVGPVDLKKIFPDGTKCTVYNVPNTKAQDDLSILITNDSMLSAELTLTLDDQDGNELFKGPVGPLDAWNTMRVSSEDLERLMKGVALDAPITWETEQPLWTKRGVLYINTIIPKIEVLALLRDKASNINSNLSTGASGVACEN